jgi:hypothetical protein
MGYDNENVVFNFSYTLYNSETGEEETREITKRCSVLNLPNLEEMEELMADFIRLTGFSYVSRVEAVTFDEDDTNKIDLGDMSQTITLSDSDTVTFNINEG